MVGRPVGTDDAEALGNAVAGHLALQGEQAAGGVLAQAGGILDFLTRGRQGGGKGGGAVGIDEMAGQALDDGGEGGLVDFGHLHQGAAAKTAGAQPAGVER